MNETAGADPRPISARSNCRSMKNQAPFSLLLEQNVWVALGYKEDVTISITARDVGIEDVSLVTIRDVEPYIEGRRRLLEPPSETPDG